MDPTTSSPIRHRFIRVCVCVSVLHMCVLRVSCVCSWSGCTASLYDHWHVQTVLCGFTVNALWVRDTLQELQTNTHTHTHTHTLVWTNTRLRYTCAKTQTHTNKHIPIHSRTNSWKYTDMQTCTANQPTNHTHTHTHTHTDRQTDTPWLTFS